MIKKAREKNSILIAIICTALIATSSLKIGLTMGLAISIALLLTYLVMNLFKSRVPSDMLMLFYVITTAFFTSLMDLVFQAYIPEVYGELGRYVPLIIFSVCMIVKTVQVDNSYSLKYAANTCIYFILSLSIISAIRGGLGTLLPSTLEHPTTLIIIGFLFAIVLGIVNKDKLKGGD